MRLDKLDDPMFERHDCREITTLQFEENILSRCLCHHLVGSTCCDVSLQGGADPNHTIRRVAFQYADGVTRYTRGISVSSGSRALISDFEGNCEDLLGVEIVMVDVCSSHVPIADDWWRSEFVISVHTDQSAFQFSVVASSVGKDYRPFLFEYYPKGMGLKTT